MTSRAVLSIDFELFRHTPAYRSASGKLSDTTVGIEAWPFLRDVLSDHDATATFFVVGEVAEQHPEVIAEIAEEGHELASHTHTHRLLSSLNPRAEIEELKKSRAAIEAATGQSEVTGFRAPAFDISTGLFEKLDKAGYRYDSSVIPARRIPGWYGGEHNVTAPCSATKFNSDVQSLAELPVSVMPSLRLPLSGAWTRLLGQKYTQAGMRTTARQERVPVLYYHPWELVDLPHIKGIPKRVTWRTGKWARHVIRRILDMDFSFVAASSIVKRTKQ
jgi:peptidoglycan/xylan/chitin deacetylase (PgdA/CDA1 family)